MKIFITGICGFVGSTLAKELRVQAGSAPVHLAGIDNLSRAGSETNLPMLRNIGVQVLHGDLRLPSDLEAVKEADWVIDAAAYPSVLAGVDGKVSSRQVVEHNLQGTINLLEFCKARSAGFILLSTSRVYSVRALASLPVEAVGGAFKLSSTAKIPGISALGIAEDFTTAAPVSLYGATKLASEQLALEYGAAFGFPVWINRCGVLAGAGQFGRSDQGIFSYWLHAWRAGRALRYIGFGGEGWQVRDCLHPADLVPLLSAQMVDPARQVEPIANLGGGPANSLSLAQLSAWCAKRWGTRKVESELEGRQFDAPLVVMNSSRAIRNWAWRVQTPINAVLDEIAAHADSNPAWLDLVG